MNSLGLEIAQKKKDLGPEEEAGVIPDLDQSIFIQHNKLDVEDDLTPNLLDRHPNLHLILDAGIEEGHLVTRTETEREPREAEAVPIISATPRSDHPVPIHAGKVFIKQASASNRSLH